jgi:hypothetical protein
MKKESKPQFFLAVLFIAWCALAFFRSMGGTDYS